MRAFLKILAGLAPLLLAAPLAAQQGRAYGVVTDLDGEPLSGVEITVTDPGTGDRVVSEQVTGNRGRYTVAVVDATRPYRFRLAKAGYQTLEEEIKIDIGANQQLDWTLAPEAERQVVARPASEDAEGPVEEELAEGEIAMSAEVAELYNAGVVALQAGDAATAKEKLAQALELEPEIAPAHAALAAISLQEGELETSIEHADRALALDPRLGLALEAKYKAHANLGQTAEAAEARAAYAAVSPEAAVEQLVSEGTAAFNAGDMASAISMLSQAVEADPDLVDPHFSLGMAYANRGDNDEALEHLQRFVESAPADHPERSAAEEMIAYLQGGS